MGNASVCLTCPQLPQRFSAIWAERRTVCSDGHRVGFQLIRIGQERPGTRLGRSGAQTEDRDGRTTGTSVAERAHGLLLGDLSPLSKESSWLLREPLVVTAGTAS
jgi:hypothetical protein